MNSKKFALIGGSLMLLMGLFALIPGLTVYSKTLPVLTIDMSYGYFLNIFPMNIINKVALIVMGLAGIAASNMGFQENKKRIDRSPVVWSRLVFYVMSTLTVLGSFERTNTFGGYWPLFGNEIWFHALCAIGGGYYGYFMIKETGPSTHTTLHRV